MNKIWVQKTQIFYANLTTQIAELRLHLHVVWIVSVHTITTLFLTIFPTSATHFSYIILSPVETIQVSTYSALSGQVSHVFSFFYLSRYSAFYFILNCCFLCSPDFVFCEAANFLHDRIDLIHNAKDIRDSFHISAFQPMLSAVLRQRSASVRIHTRECNIFLVKIDGLTKQLVKQTHKT